MEFDKVKAEKADAMRRYKRQRFTLFCFKIIAVSVLIYCSLSSSLPLLLHKASLYLSLHFRVFLLLNAIVLLVYYSSSTSAAAVAASSNDEQTPLPHPSDLYDEYLSQSKSYSSLKFTTDADKQLVVAPPVEEAVHDKQIVVCEVNARREDIDDPVENLVRDLSVAARCCDVKNEEEKPYRRTQSEKFVREVKSSSGRRSRRELRRSETAKSMEDMNSEEFRMTVERFIETKKKILRDENMALMTQETTTHFMSVTTTTYSSAPDHD